MFCPFIDAVINDGLIVLVGKAEKQTFLHTQELDLCIQLQKSQSDKTYPTGDHVITIVPHEKENLILAWLITP